MASNVTEPGISDQKSGVCMLCLKEKAKYNCPRCNTAYCSSACYKSEAHTECSEAFYKDCVMEGLQDYNAISQDKTKILEMLARLEQDNPVLDSDDDEDEEEDLEDRMQNLNLDTDTDEIWEKLTSKEKAEFKAMLSDGRLGNMVELWEPWWKYKKDSLVHEVGLDSPSAPGPSHPELYRHAPDITSVLKSGAPSPLIPNTVVNVLYGYAYVARLHNGDHGDTPQQSAQELCLISLGLGNQNFNTVSEAVHSCMACIQNRKKQLLISQEYSVAVLRDVTSLLSGPHQREPLTYVLAALSHLRDILRSAKKYLDKELKKGKESQKSEKEKQKQQLFSAQKKAEFLIGWTQKFGLSLDVSRREVELEFCALSSELSSHQRDQGRLETAWKGPRPPRMHKFIEEITDR